MERKAEREREEYKLEVLSSDKEDEMTEGRSKGKERLRKEEKGLERVM